MFKLGDTPYIYDNTRGWVQVRIIRISGNYYTIRHLDKSCGYRVPSHRLIAEQEYQDKYSVADSHRIYPPTLH